MIAKILSTFSPVHILNVTFYATTSIIIEMCLKSYRINQDLSKWGKVVYFHMPFMLGLALLSENVSYSWQRPLAGCLKFKAMRWYLQLVKRWSKKAWKLINFTQLHSSCCFFFCAFVFCSLMSLVLLFLWLEDRSFCVCFCFYFAFLVSGPFN